MHTRILSSPSAGLPQADRRTAAGFVRRADSKWPVPGHLGPRASASGSATHIGTEHRIASQPLLSNVDVAEMKTNLRQKRQRITPGLCPVCNGTVYWAEHTITARQ